MCRVCALKSVGMPLTQIGRVLDSESLGDVLRPHLDHVEREARGVLELRDRLRRLEPYMDEPVPSERLATLIEG